MPETPGNASLADLLREEIPRLAVLYDRFAHALDPFDPVRDVAEQTFNSEIAQWFDLIGSAKADVPRIPSARGCAVPATPARER